ncbi:MAG: hypothetical protein IJ875_03200 [Solobacterium sp.]|nr:hypothetical protein [Solobacterium sp.]
MLKILNILKKIVSILGTLFFGSIAFLLLFYQFAIEFDFSLLLFALLFAFFTYGSILMFHLGDKEMNGLSYIEQQQAYLEGRNLVGNTINKEYNDKEMAEALRDTREKNDIEIEPTELENLLQNRESNSHHSQTK